MGLDAALPRLTNTPKRLLGAEYDQGGLPNFIGGIFGFGSCLGQLFEWGLWEMVG